VDKLQARRREVSRQDKYTDLPGELRQQQIALIDDHLRDFRGIHERALKVALKTGRGESADATRAKLANPRSYADLPADQREADQLRDRTTVLQNDIDTTRKQIFDGSKAAHRGAQSVGSGVTSKQLNEQTASWKAKIAAAFELDKRQMQLKAKSDELREAWNSETTPKRRLEKLRAVAACLDERLKLMQVQLFDVQEAAPPSNRSRHRVRWPPLRSSGRRSRVTNCPRTDRQYRSNSGGGGGRRLVARTRDEVDGLVQPDHLQLGVAVAQGCSGLGEQAEQR
jgi:hypothetical protein